MANEATRASLQQVLNGFAQRPAVARRALEQWYRTDRAAFVAISIQHLGSALVRPAERELARLLAGHPEYVKSLIDPALMNVAEAIHAANPLSHEDVRFIPRLVAACEEDNRAAVVMRALDIVVALNRVAVVVAWLQEMTRHSDPRVQSKASLVFCRLYANPTLVERQLGSTDDRVRANAVEALWGLNNPTNRAILDKAVEDRHHRVAVNALVGLYMLRVPGTVERLVKFAGNRSPLFRAATAWAMGHTGDPVFRPQLESLVSDPAAAVRKAAETALEHLLTSARPGHCP